MPGASPARSRYEPDLIGYNYRMTEWQGAILLAQLERLPQHIARREENAAISATCCKRFPASPRAHASRKSRSTAAPLYVPLSRRPLRRPAQRRVHPRPASGGRALQPRLSAAHTSPAIRRRWPNSRARSSPGTGRQRISRREPCPVCEKVCQETVWLYQSQLLAEKQDMEEIASAIRKIQTGKGIRDKRRGAERKTLPLGGLTDLERSIWARFNARPCRRMPNSIRRARCC